MELAAKLRLPASLKVDLDLINSDMGKYLTPTCYTNLQHFTADTLHEKVQRDFLKSTQYQVFLKDAPPDFTLDSTIMHLSDFKEDRQLKQTKDNYGAALQKDGGLTFESLIASTSDTLVSQYYRRFLRAAFCEENWIFVMAINNFRLEFNDLDLSDAANSKWLEEEAIRLFEMFITVERTYEVNIPDKNKQEVKTKMDGKNYDAGMFE